MNAETQSTDSSFEIVAPSALEAQERAQCDIQISTAHRFPRPALSAIKEKMKSFATLDEETAEGCFYVLNRQGKEIRGPSARLAEIAVSCYGNLRAASRVIANDGKMITSQAVCHDLENNVSVSIEVKRRITGRDGKTFSDDMQVVTGNAACSIALRNAVFKVIPMALIRPVYDAARSAAIGDVKTLGARREKAMETFIKMGVTKERVLLAVDKPTVDDIDLAALEILLGLHTAVKDGDISIDEAFPPQPPKKPIFSKKPETPLPTESGSSQVSQPLDRGNAAGSESIGASNPESPKTSGGSKTKRDGVADSQEPVSPAPTTTKSPEAGAAASGAPGNEDAESKITRLMAEDHITAHELGRVLKSFGVKIPANFLGPQSMTDPVAQDVLGNWTEYRGVILAERKASAP